MAGQEQGDDGQRMEMGEIQMALKRFYPSLLLTSLSLVEGVVGSESESIWWLLGCGFVVEMNRDVGCMVKKALLLFVY